MQPGDRKQDIEAVAAANLQWMDGTMWYHAERTRVLERLLRGGELGPVMRVSAAFTFHAPDEQWLQVHAYHYVHAFE